MSCKTGGGGGKSHSQCRRRCAGDQEKKIEQKKLTDWGENSSQNGNASDDARLCTAHSMSCYERADVCTRSLSGSLHCQHNFDFNNASRRCRRRRHRQLPLIKESALYPFKWLCAAHSSHWCARTTSTQCSAPPSMKRCHYSGRT